MGKFKVSEEDCRGMFVEIANTVFDQAWVLESDFSGTDKVEEGAEGKKRRRVNRDLTLQFPARRSLRDWMEAAAVLNPRHVALLLKHKPGSVVSTLGVDDATKAAGHKTYDVKATHLTLKDKDTGNRDVYTTGYMENSSHSPEAAAENMQCTIEMLAILGHCTPDEIKDALDFWMSDRAADVDPTLDILGVEEKKRIKCCAHILLCIDEAIEKVIRRKERKIGTGKLLHVPNAKFDAEHMKGSVLMSGQIALAKMLSPSHAKEGVSLYSSFTAFLEDRDQKNKFKGFTSNRFGRRADTAVAFREVKAELQVFFDEQVDMGQNMLWAAVGAYVKSDWFNECNSAYQDIAEWLIYPLMDILGIDQHADAPDQDRTWSGVRNFFRKVLPDLEVKRKRLANTGLLLAIAFHYIYELYCA
jgi:hypothetical protein